MATILDNYRNLQNNYRSQIAANSLPLEDNLKMQEVNYRICVLETFESLSKSAPITTDPKVMGYHYQLVDGYVKFVLTERKFGPKTDAEGMKKRCLLRNERLPQRPLKRSFRMAENAFPASNLLPKTSISLRSGIIS